MDKLENTDEPFASPPKPKRRRIQLAPEQKETVVSIYLAGRERGEHPRVVMGRIIQKYGICLGTLQSILKSAGATQGAKPKAEKLKKKSKAEQWLSGADAPRAELSDIHGKPVRVELKRDGYLEIGNVKLKLKEARALTEFMTEYFR